MRWLSLLAFLLAGRAAQAVEIQEAYGEKAVILRYDEYSEFVEQGDRFFVMIEGKKRGLLLVTKVGKGNTALAFIIKGVAPLGAPLQSLQRVQIQQSLPPAPAPGMIKTPKKGEQAVEQLSATFLVMSNSLFRGQTTSNNGPAVKGALNYDFKNRWTVGMFLGNSAAPVTSEADFYASYTFGDEKYGASLIYYRYELLEGGNASMNDFILKLTASNVFLEASYIPNWVGVKSSDIYGRLGLSVAISKKLSSNFAIGFSNFQKNERVGYKDYVDGRIGVVLKSNIFDTELAWSGANRENLNGGELKDQSVLVIFSKSL